MTEYEIPKRASAGKLKTIIKGYYTEGAHNEPVKTGAVEAATGISDVVGRQTNFLLELGVLEKDGTSRSLTPQGVQLAEFLMASNEKGAKQVLRELFSNWGLSEKLERFTSMNPDGVTKDELLEYIDSNASSSNQTGQKAIIDLMEWCDILEVSEEGQYSISQVEYDAADESVSSQDSREEDSTGSDPSSNTVTEETSVINPNAGGSLSVELDFDASDDPQSVKQVIKAAREALNQNLDSE